MNEPDTETAALLQFLYACPMGLLEFDAAGAVTMANPVAMQLLLPISGAPFVTNIFRALASSAPEIRNIVPAFAAEQGTVCDCHRIFVNASADRPAVLSCTIVKLSNSRFIATLTDISRQVAQERRLKEAETWFATLIDGVDDVAVLSLDDAGLIDAVTHAALKQTGMKADELIGMSPEALERPDAASGTPPPGHAIATARRDGWHLYEGWHAFGQDDRYWCQRLVAVRQQCDDQEIGGYTVVLRAVKRQDRSASDLRSLLSRDYLTGASNRAHFFESAESELLRCRRSGGTFSIVAMDVDHFKRINDAAGHAAGDSVLRELTSVCKADLRPEDTFARFGGEEFIILLPGSSLADAGRAAERLRTLLADHSFVFNGAQLSVTASFGCVSARTLQESISDLVARADDALYRAKRGGRNQVAMIDVVDVAA